jgi:hypothetical protein
MPTPSTEVFTLFPLLPKELRLQIWEEVAAQPRILELTCTPTSSSLPEGRWMSHTKTPSIFQVCSESQEIALASYSVLKFSDGQIGIPPKPPLYIDFEVDTLWFCGDLQSAWARDLLEKNEILKEKLKFLKVKEKTWKELNQVDLTPIWSSYAGVTMNPCPTPVRSGLKVLEYISFHS